MIYLEFNPLAALLVLLITITDFLIAVPIFLKIALKRFQFLHKHVTSDIPGNPHAFDESVISLFRTLPEPSNFNIVWTSVPLDEPLLIQGQKFPGRVHSITIYNNKKLNELPITCDLESIIHDEQFEIVLVKDDECDSIIPNFVYLSSNKLRKVISCHGWSSCMISFRNYLVPPGVSIETPTLSSLRNKNVVLRPSQNFITGPAALKEYQNNRLRAYYRKIGFANIIGGLCLQWACNYTVAQAVLCLSVCGLLSKAGRQLCFEHGKKSLRTMMTEINSNTYHKFFYPSVKASSSASQPSALHKYWVMAYDLSQLPQGVEVQIAGVIFPEKQKYWSIIVYDEYGLPLPAYVHDESVRRIASESDNSYSFDVRLAKNSARRHELSKLTSKVTPIDVSSCIRGYILFRIVHPASEDVVTLSAPKASLLSYTSKNKVE